MSLNREQMLIEMGISPLWELRGVPSEAVRQPAEQLEAIAEPADPPPLPTPPASGCDVGSLDWPALEEGIRACRRCPLGQQRRQAVPGIGDRRPDWLFIGEGPGAEEDQRGEPFVGQAGKLLDAMLAAISLERGQGVYIANAVKCRPPNNRTPEAAEMAACSPWLERQIELLKPRVIVLLGKAAVHSVLGGDRALASLRGRAHEYRGIPVAVTYHPAYLLRNLPDKAKAWEDLLFARRLLAEGKH